MHTRLPPFLLMSALLLSPLAALAQDLDLTTILRKHRRAQADVTKIYGADSLRLKGETTQQGTRYAFTLFKKAPDLLRYEISYKGRSFVIIYDGDHGYFWSPDEPDRPVQVASGMQEYMLRQESFFDGPLVSAGARGFSTEYKGLFEVPYNPNPVYYIELRSVRGDEVMDVFLDSVSFLEVMRTIRPGEDDEPLVTRFSDFRDVEGFTIPFKIVNSFADEVLSTTRVREAEVNAGILGFFFELPEEKRSQAAR